MNFRLTLLLSGILGNALSAEAQTPLNCDLCALVNSIEKPLDFKQRPGEAVYTYKKDDLREADYRFSSAAFLESSYDLLTPTYKLNMNALCTQFKSIRDRGAFNTNGSIISGLRMSYGVKDGKLVILFDFVTLNRVAGGRDFEVKPKEPDTNDMFMVKSNGDIFRPLKEDAEQMLSSYMYVRFIRNTGPSEFFKLGYDVVSSVMPLQELVEVFHSIQESSCSHNTATDNCVYFKIVPDTFGADKNYKLHVVAFVDGGIRFTNAFEGFAADFSQMNPPASRNVVLPPFTGEATPSLRGTLKKAASKKPVQKIKQKTKNK